jgi:hypothetical protein
VSGVPNPHRYNSRFLRRGSIGKSGFPFHEYGLLEILGGTPMGGRLSGAIQHDHGCLHFRAAGRSARTSSTDHGLPGYAALLCRRRDWHNASRLFFRGARDAYGAQRIVAFRWSKTHKAGRVASPRRPRFVMGGLGTPIRSEKTMGISLFAGSSLPGPSYGIFGEKKDSKSARKLGSLGSVSITRPTTRKHFRSYSWTCFTRTNRTSEN